MSKGTKTYAVRISAGLVDRIKDQIDSRNRFSMEEPWDLSAFVRVCLERELAKMKRSREYRRRRRERLAAAGGAIGTHPAQMER